MRISILRIDHHCHSPNIFAHWNRLVYDGLDGGVADIPDLSSEKAKEPMQSLDTKSAENMCIALKEETKGVGGQTINACMANDDRLMQDRPDQELAEAMNLITQEEIDAVKNALLPDSSINKTVKFFTGQNKLEGYQRVLLAPANAFEGVARGIIGLPDTIDSMFKAASEADTRSLDAAGKLVWDVFMNHMSMAEKSAIGVQLVGESITGAGLVSLIGKISKSATVMGIMTRIGNALPKFQKAGKVGLVTRVGEKALGVAKVVEESKIGGAAIALGKKPAVKTAFKIGSEGKDLAKSATEKTEKAQKALVEKGKTIKKGGSDRAKA